MKYIIDIDEDLFNELLQGTASNKQNDKILKCVKKAELLQEELEEIKKEIFDLPTFPFVYNREAECIVKSHIAFLMDRKIKDLNNETDK